MPYAHACVPGLADEPLAAGEPLKARLNLAGPSTSHGNAVIVQCLDVIAVAGQELAERLDDVATRPVAVGFFQRLAPPVEVVKRARQAGDVLLQAREDAVGRTDRLVQDGKGRSDAGGVPLAELAHLIGA
jgi:hypothetical protein